MINCLKNTEMSIHKIKKYLKLCREGDNILKQRYDIILKQKELYYQKAIEIGEKKSVNLDENKKG